LLVGTEIAWRADSLGEREKVCKKVTHGWSSKKKKKKKKEKHYYLKARKVQVAEGSEEVRGRVERGKTLRNLLDLKRSVGAGVWGTVHKTWSRGADKERKGGLL